VVFTIKAATRWAAVLLTTGGLAATALAQESQPPDNNSFGPRVQPQAGGKNLPPPEIVATHGDWKVQCETPPANPNAPEGSPAPKKICGMVQLARSDKNPKVVMRLLITKAKQQNKDMTMMQVVAPVGVYLPTGVALEIDGAAVGRVPFTRCVPQACVAFAEAQDQTLAKMKKGTAANFIIYEAPGIGLPLKISLNGFSAALDELTKL